MRRLVLHGLRVIGGVLCVVGIVVGIPGLCLQAPTFPGNSGQSTPTLGGVLVMLGFLMIRWAGKKLGD
jgi:hypothetical protein